MKTLTLSLLLFLGCVPAAAIHQARGQIAISQGHVRLSSPGTMYHEVSQDAEDAWSIQLFALDGTPLSEEVEARVKAREVEAE